MTEAAPRKTKTGRAFTIIEVLVVVAIIALLVAILLPGLGRARRQATAVACAAHIRQLALANDLYSRDFGGRYVPGAAFEMRQNLDRWHGRRASMSQPFDGASGPLSPYCGQDRRIRACPSLEVDNARTASAVHFEAGCGGYGYNKAYLGVRDPYVFDTEERGSAVGTRVDRIRKPAETIMFADAAFAAEALIEYSFAEPRFHPRFAGRADPSIHFRHMGLANVAWCDMHVSGQRRTFTWSSGVYSGDPNRHGIGWFGETDDNQLFDLQ